MQRPTRSHASCLVLLIPLTFVLSYVTAPHAHAGTQGGPPNYSVMDGATYDGSPHSIGAEDYYPLSVSNHQQSVLPYIHKAESDCRNAGYQACNFSVDYRDQTQQCEGNPGPCFVFDASGISTSQQVPRVQGPTGPQDNYTYYYAITDIIATLSANPTSITLGDSSTLTWSSNSEDTTDGVTCSINNGVGSVAPNGSKQVQPTETTTYTLTCKSGVSYDPDETTATATVNVTDDEKADLIPMPANNRGVVSPTTAVIGGSTEFSAALMNQGTAETSADFPDLFEINADSIPEDFADIGHLRTYDNASLSAGDSATASFTQDAGIFNTTGTWYVRLCANMDTQGNKPPAGGAGAQNESNYENNCGVWTAISVTANAPTCSLKANPTEIQQGDSSTLTWSSNGATSCTGSGFSTGGNTGGHTDVSPAQTTTYSVTCQDGSNPPQKCSAPVTVAVDTGGCNGTMTGDVSANPSRVVQGDTTTLTATAKNVQKGQTCHVYSTPGGYDSGGFSGGDSCDVNWSGPNNTPTVNVQTTYTLSCAGAKLDTATVDVIPYIEEF